MWQPELEKLLKEAGAAVEHAQHIRDYHRRRTDVRSPQRMADIKIAMERIREAMNPLRTEIGRFPYAPQTEKAEDNRKRIKDLSVALQRERRKLWKMKERGK